MVDGSLTAVGQWLLAASRLQVVPLKKHLHVVVLLKLMSL